MFLHLEKVPVPMKLVYELSVALENDPEYIKVVQALTLNKSRPFMGLKGTYGLYGSAKWWNSIRTGVMPLRHVSGVIVRTFWAGQDTPDGHNSFNFRCDTGEVVSESFYANNPEDCALFKVGCRVEILYAIDEYKEPSFNDGSGMVLEMAVSI
jgi:hypothetical protein